jgi:Flp pilus assembly pilin Flp
VLEGVELMFAKLRRSIMDFLRREDGPTPVEYAIIFALVLVACVVTFSMFAPKNKPKPQQNFRTKIIKAGKRR